MNEILSINNIHGYMDKENGTAYLNAEDVARGFGFTRGKNGVEYVMWDRVNRYLAEFGFSALVRKSDYLPENMVYRLGFKASNEVAQKFQALLADEVIPAIRKHGAYMTGETLEKALTSPDFLIRLATELKTEKEKRLAAEKQVELDRPQGRVQKSTSPAWMDRVDFQRWRDHMPHRLPGQGYKESNSAGCNCMGSGRREVPPV